MYLVSSPERGYYIFCNFNCKLFYLRHIFDKYNFIYKVDIIINTLQKIQLIFVLLKILTVVLI